MTASQPTMQRALSKLGRRISTGAADPLVSPAGRRLGRRTMKSMAEVADVLPPTFGAADARRPYFEV